MDHAMFEVTQILASRVDTAGDQWVLVQWGCSWVLRSGIADGPLLTEFNDKAKLFQRVNVPIEAGSQLEVDAAAYLQRAHMHPPSQRLVRHTNCAPHATVPSNHRASQRRL